MKRFMNNSLTSIEEKKEINIVENFCRMKGKYKIQAHIFDKYWDAVKASQYLQHLPSLPLLK